MYIIYPSTVTKNTLPLVDGANDVIAHIMTRIFYATSTYITSSATYFAHLKTHKLIQNQVLIYLINFFHVFRLTNFFTTGFGLRYSSWEQSPWILYTTTCSLKIQKNVLFLKNVKYHSLNLWYLWGLGFFFPFNGLQRVRVFEKLILKLNLMPLDPIRRSVCRALWRGSGRLGRARHSTPASSCSATKLIIQ